MKAGTFVAPSREYLGGILAGIGIGILIANALVSSSERRIVFSPWVWILAFVCIAVGSLLAKAAQRRRSREAEANGQRPA